MPIYTQYVFDDQLVSPVTGYSCCRITKQNIKQFGFESVGELQEKYPGFPLMCKEYHNHVKNSNKSEKRKSYLKERREKFLLEKARINDIERAYYTENPLTCSKCLEPKPFEKRKNKFCSRVCANSKEQTDEINKQRSVKLKKPETCKIEFIKCRTCANTFIRSKHKSNTRRRQCQTCYKPKKPQLDSSFGDFTRIRFCNVCKRATTNIKGKYCKQCSPNISHYRTQANFNFNVYEYPKEFDLDLIEKYGWYSPNGYKRRNKAPNLDGVSKDHLYSVSDGFNNNIDPVILSHPANCRIMKHNGKNGNNSKHSNSCISIEDLKLRILEWNERNGGFPKI